MTRTPLTANESIYQVRLLTNANKLIIRDATAITYGNIERWDEFISTKWSEKLTEYVSDMNNEFFIDAEHDADKADYVVAAAITMEVDKGFPRVLTAATYPSHKNETRDALDVTRAIMTLVDPNVEPELALGQMLEYNEWLALYPALKHITVKGIDIDLTSGEVSYLTKYAGHTVWFSKASIDGGGLIPLWKDGNDDIEEEEDEV